MKKEQKVRVGISIGDLNGIGSEIILKTFQDPRMLDFCTPVIFANTKLMSFYKKHYKININFQGVEDASKVIDGKLNVVNVWKENTKINFGKEDKFLGEFTVKSLEAATDSLMENSIDTLVTAPINKNMIQSEEFNFPGHTDYLAKKMKGDSLMLMLCENLRIGLLTDHLAVKDVAAAITPALIQKKVSIIHDTLKKDFRIQKPKIAILGINPHSGDNGVIGKEDEEVLKPAILKINERGTLVYGPYSADSFFGTKNYKNFDAVIAAYHDQGLVPFKTLSFGRGVNFTAGLSKIRTSPDHGTAYEIAGKGEADFTSFKEAVFTSVEIYKCRDEYQELTENPLRRQARK
jgi:4-hydroxythreonine-4-phosphate dehydrogenase